MIKAIQVRRPDLDGQRTIGRKREIRTRFFPPGQSLNLLGDAVGVEVFEVAAALDGGLNPLHGMGRQELQDAHVLTGAGCRTVARFQALPQGIEIRRKPPAAIDVGVIQGRGAPTEGDQVMQRIKDLLAVFIGTNMTGHDLVTAHHLDVIDVALDRDGPNPS